MDRIDTISGISRRRADQPLKALEQAFLPRIAYGGIVVRVLSDLRNCGA
jgi:hypothetical protein